MAEQYGITADAIKVANNLRSNNLSIGQVLKIPTSKVQSEPLATVITVPETRNTIVQDPKDANKHTVSAGETIFSIAQKYNLTAYQVRQANNITDNAISVGQKLIIPAGNAPRSVTEVARDERSNMPDTSATIKDPSLRRNANVYGLNQVEEKGIAVWISDPDLDATKMMVLHRTLPVGSVIKITNPMSNISAFVKVVGKFTENETTKDVIIVITKAVAEKLGVLDKRFFCNIMYASQDHEQ
ncbi:MAG: LysM peptidoglycan-binding domain-containing protein [Pedobacter sp.]|nr:MAG: LysM peptidoglycan-binding domain-containing protein [Pedobacter sp.]